MLAKKINNTLNPETFKEIGSSRWGFDPFLPLMSLKMSVDEMFSEIFINKASLRRETIFHPKADVYAHNNKCHIEVELPGVDKKNIRFHVSKNHLIVFGANTRQVRLVETSFSLKERLLGIYFKNISLKQEVMPEKFDAVFEDGVLKITLELVK